MSACNLCILSVSHEWCASLFTAVLLIRTGDAVLSLGRLCVCGGGVCVTVICNIMQYPTTPTELPVGTLWEDGLGVAI